MRILKDGDNNYDSLKQNNSEDVVRSKKASLTEDKYSDFEVGTCFRLVDEKVDDRYRHHYTVYEVIRILDSTEAPEALFNVFGHDYSKVWRKPVAYLEAGKAKGAFIILSEDEKRELFVRKK